MPPKGRKLSLESRERISVARRIPQADCVCLNCGNHFQTHQSEVRRGGGKFCNKSCESKYRAGKPIPKEVCEKRSASLKGRIITPEWRAKISASSMGKHGTRTGKPVPESQREKQRLAMQGRSHTKEHNFKIQCNTPRGKDSPHWNGGTSFGKYCPKFNNEFKERVRAFFGYTCLECGEPQNGEKLTVHHVLYNKQTCCDDTVPLFAPLCRSCHSKTNFEREVWEKRYADIIMQYYGGKSFLTKEEMLALK